MCVLDDLSTSHVCVSSHALDLEERSLHIEKPAADPVVVVPERPPGVVVDVAVAVAVVAFCHTAEPQFLV